MYEETAQTTAQQHHFIRQTQQTMIQVHTLQKEFIIEACKKFDNLLAKKPPYQEYELRYLKNQLIDQWKYMQTITRARLTDLADSAASGSITNHQLTEQAA